MEYFFLLYSLYVHDGVYSNFSAFQAIFPLVCLLNILYNHVISVQFIHVFMGVVLHNHCCQKNKVKSNCHIIYRMLTRAGKVVH